VILRYFLNDNEHAAQSQHKTGRFNLITVSFFPHVSHPGAGMVLRTDAAKRTDLLDNDQILILTF
jgi:hypothetical protein